jgi:hypothetical protein
LITQTVARFSDASEFNVGQKKETTVLVTRGVNSMKKRMKRPRERREDWSRGTDIQLVLARTRRPRGVLAADPADTRRAIERATRVLGQTRTEQEEGRR